MHSEVTKDRTVRSDSQQPMLLPSEEKEEAEHPDTGKIQPFL
jgi:hypothetical protein